jgi:hypothetical protein
MGASVSRIVFDWAFTYNFYVAKDWFGMIDLDLQSHVVPSGVVSNSPFASVLLFISLLPSLMKSYSLFQIRKFSIKIIVCLNSVLRVREEAMHEYGYNVKRDGWLNAFIDEKSQAMRSDGVP